METTILGLKFLKMREYLQLRRPNRQNTEKQYTETLAALRIYTYLQPGSCLDGTKLDQ